MILQYYNRLFLISQIVISALCILGVSLPYWRTAADEIDSSLEMDQIQESILCWKCAESNEFVTFYNKAVILNEFEIPDIVMGVIKMF